MNVYFKYSKRLLQMFVATRYATQIRSSSNVCRYSICDLEKVEFKCFEVSFERTEPLFDDRRRNGNRAFLTYRTKCVDRNRLQPLNFKGWGRFNLF